MESTNLRENNPVINLSKAVKDVQSGSNITVAAAKHNIPVSILFNRVSAIRQLKEKKSRGEMQSSSNETPDKYGLVVNEKLFRKKGSSRRKYIYVNQLYYNALHFALEGNSLEDTILNFKVRKHTLIMKLRHVKAYQNQQSRSNHMPSRNKLAERKNEKHLSLFDVLKTLVESCSVSLPEKFISAMFNIYKGENFGNVAEIFSFDEISFSKVVRMLRVFQKLSTAYIKSKSNVIQSLLPSIHSSFSSITLTQDESLECLHMYFLSKSVRSRSYDYEALKTARREIENGLAIKQASDHFNIPFSTLRDYAIKRNIYKIGHNSQNMDDIPSHDVDEVKIISISPQKNAVCPIKSKGKRSQPLCLFCHQPGYREEEIGKLHILNKVIVHYYCLLFSCALEQNGDDDEGILGFLPKDIIKEINRGKRLKCSHCGLKGATIGCSYKNCKKVYHFPCGLDSCAQFIFTDNFSSMCSKHRKYQNGQGKGLTLDCPICLESMEADPKHAVWPPCCKRSSWFHRKCIQKLALSAGYFFKCPLCNDKNVFTSEMLRQGIFVPDQDASWELVPNAYQELLERPIRCTAPVCRCPSGRNSDEEGTRWEVLLCYYCGSTGIHIFCGNLKPSSTEWHCPTCVAMLEERSQRDQSEVLRATAQVLKRKKCDLGEENQDSSDEEQSDNSLSKRKRRGSSRLSQQPSSSNVASNLDSDIDQIISVPRRVRGHIVIRDLIENNEPLNETLEEMKQYAENISQKLVDSNIEKIAFLNLINTTNSSSSHSRKRYIINETHFQKFEACSLNYDQMRFLRNVFELGLALSLRKSKFNSTSRASRLNPFCRKKRRYKDVLQVKESLLNLLIKAKSANLLEEDNTWSSYGNRQKNAYFNKVNSDLPSTSSEREIGTSDIGRRSTSHSPRYAPSALNLKEDSTSFLDDLENFFETDDRIGDGDSYFKSNNYNCSFDSEIEILSVVDNDGIDDSKASSSLNVVDVASEKNLLKELKAKAAKLKVVLEKISEKENCESSTRSLRSKDKRITMSPLKTSNNLNKIDSFKSSPMLDVSQVLDKSEIDDINRLSTPTDEEMTQSLCDAKSLSVTGEINKHPIFSLGIPFSKGDHAITVKRKRHRKKDINKYIQKTLTSYFEVKNK